MKHQIISNVTKEIITMLHEYQNNCQPSTNVIKTSNRQRKTILGMLWLNRTIFAILQSKMYLSKNVVLLTEKFCMVFFAVKIGIIKISGASYALGAANFTILNNYDICRYTLLNALYTCKDIGNG